MQILLNTDPHVGEHAALLEQLESVVHEVLGQFGDRITGVEAHLTDTDNATPAGPGNVHCTLEARLDDHELVVAKHHAGTAGQALHGALRKLGCVLASEFEKQENRHASRLRAHTEVVDAPHSAAAPL